MYLCVYCCAFLYISTFYGVAKYQRVGDVKRLNQYVGHPAPSAATDPPHTPLSDIGDQISHDTVNQMPCSIVWKGIIARDTNPRAGRDKY